MSYLPFYVYLSTRDIESTLGCISKAAIQGRREDQRCKRACLYLSIHIYIVEVSLPPSRCIDSQLHYPRTITTYEHILLSPSSWTVLSTQTVKKGKSKTTPFKRQCITQAAPSAVPRSPAKPRPAARAVRPAPSRETKEKKRKLAPFFFSVFIHHGKHQASEWIGKKEYQHRPRLAISTISTVNKLRGVHVHRPGRRRRCRRCRTNQPASQPVSTRSKLTSQ
ncbi:hypothetical protein F5X96DRAFT_115073 [Biscogniauxia mediterranea]|nr:hypothetical protein F5X96DRAFT_115073 [Biscogniauxia mediterranea]